MNRAEELAGGNAEMLRTLRARQDELLRIQRTCKHKWGPVQYTPDIREAYRTEGDPVGTMGIDWRGPQYVDRQVTKKWSRHCPVCTLTQTTTYTKQVPRTGGSIPGTTGTEEVPVFPGDP